MMVWMMNLVWNIDESTKSTIENLLLISVRNQPLYEICPQHAHPLPSQEELLSDTVNYDKVQQVLCSYIHCKLLSPYYYVGLASGNHSTFSHST